jgi:hypothetical protein
MLAASRATARAAHTPAPHRIGVRCRAAQRILPRPTHHAVDKMLKANNAVVKEEPAAPTKAAAAAGGAPGALPAAASPRPPMRTSNPMSMDGWGPMRRSAGPQHTLTRRRSRSPRGQVPHVPPMPCAPPSPAPPPGCRYAVRRRGPRRAARPRPPKFHGQRLGRAGGPRALCPPCSGPLRLRRPGEQQHARHPQRHRLQSGRGGGHRRRSLAQHAPRPRLLRPAW